MHSPKLYRALQIPLKMIVTSDYRLKILQEDLSQYLERQTDNAEFGQIRRITGKEWERDRIIEELIYVDLGTASKKKEVVEEIVQLGFIFNGQHWVPSERAGSMKRNGFASFVRSDIALELDKALTMGVEVDSLQVVYSKYSAYRGLFLSSGFLIGA